MSEQEKDIDVPEVVDKDSFGGRLRELATALRLTQKELCEAAGVSRTAMSKYVAGGSSPRFEALQKWGQAFGINMNWLFFGEGAMLRPAAASSLPALREFGHLRLVHDRSGVAERLAPYGSKEVYLSHPEVQAIEAQHKLLEQVVGKLREANAPDDMIQRAILAITAGVL